MSYHCMFAQSEYGPTKRERKGISLRNSYAVRTLYPPPRRKGLYGATGNERLEQANELIRLIASHGRRFFHHEGRIAELRLDARGRVWLVDEYSGQSMRRLIERLRDYIKRGTPLPLGIICPVRSFSGPENIWGYESDEAEKLIAACRSLPIFIASRDLGCRPFLQVTGRSL